MVVRLSHDLLVAGGGLAGVEFADAAVVVGVIDMGGVGGVDECEVYGVVVEGEFACVVEGDVWALWVEVVTDAFAVEVFADIEGGSGAAHGIDDGVVYFGVAFEELVDDPGGGGADVVLVALHGAEL